MIVKRFALYVIIVLLGALTRSQAAEIDDALNKLAADAAKAGNVIWYESSPDDQATKIAAAFNKRHRTVGEIDWLLGSHAELTKVWNAWGVRPETDPNDPEEIEHNAEIFAIDPQGQIRALYPPSFKPEKLAEGSRALAQL